MVWGTAVTAEDVFFDFVFKTRRMALEKRIPGALNDVAILRDKYLNEARAGGPCAIQSGQRAMKLNDLVNEFVRIDNPHRAKKEGATAETLIKVGRYDPVDKLVEKGVLGAGHQKSARSIARMFESITAVVMARGSELNPDRIGCGGHFTGLRVSESIWDRYRNIYKPWTVEMHRLEDQHLPLVMDVCIDGVSVAVARLKHRMGRSRAVTHLKNGLELYEGYWLRYRDDHLED